MKKIVVIYDGDDWNVKIPMSYELTRHAFEKWQTMALEKGIEMFRSSVDWFDEKTGAFTKAWAYRDGQWKQVHGPIMADLIYDKTAGASGHALYQLKITMSKHCKVFNNPMFRLMLDDKLSQYAIFSEYMPATWVATNKDELREVSDKITTSKIVAKPLQGSGGFGIVIGDIKKIMKTTFKYPILIQEFVNNSNGIPEFSNPGELADLRIVFINHKPLYAISRVAKKGSLFTNQHQGAHSVRVPLDAVPQSVWNITEGIIKKLSIFSQAQYSLDFFFAEEKPYFIEMNTVPGLCIIEELGDEKLQREDFDAFISLLE